MKLKWKGIFFFFTQMSSLKTGLLSVPVDIGTSNYGDGLKEILFKTFKYL